MDNSREQAAVTLPARFARHSAAWWALLERWQQRSRRERLVLPQSARLSRRVERARHVAKFSVTHLAAAHVPVSQASFFAATERTQRRERSGRAVLVQLGPLSINDHRPPVGWLRHTQPWAVQRGEQGRKDSSTVKTFVAFVQSDATPLPRPCRLLEEEMRAVRTNPPRVHDATVMHAPETRIVLEDSPLQPFQRRDDCAEGPVTVSHGLLLSRCSLRAALMHFAKVASGIQPSHSACVSAITDAKESKTGSSSSMASSAPS